MLAEVKSGLDVTRISGLEAARLLRRDKSTYLNSVRGLYLLSVVDCELGRVARSSYFSLRLIDDVLDGDRQDVSNPLEFAMKLRAQVESGVFDSQHPASVLTQDAIGLLEKRAKPGDSPRADFLRSIDSVIFDYERSKQRKALSEEELETYYDQTFSPVLNLMLIGLRSNLRAGDIPELVSSQGHIYSIRDLDDDWDRGIINIPQEVLTTANLSPNSSLEQVKSSPYVQEWILKDLERSKKDLETLTERLSRQPEWLTRKMCNGLIKPMMRFTAK